MKNYKVGIYLRLSKEDVNDSIENQREITMKYANENNYTVIKEYVDNGISGFLDSRPGLTKMINDIKNHYINMVIVKDISRLTRDKNLTGYFIEVFFPENDVRFISVTEYIDSGERYEIDDTIGLRGIINQSYLEDLSQKIKSVKTNFKEQGKFIENSVLYGYKKDETDKYKIVIDNEPAGVVRKIFREYIDGKKPIDIAQNLNINHVPTPSQYKKLRNQSPYWTKALVNRILNDPTYTGKMIINKYYNDFKRKKRVVTKYKDMKFIENTHEAIISNEDFELVKNMKLSKTKESKGDYYFLLRELVYCKNCGRRMLYRNLNPCYSNTNLKEYKENGYYECGVHYRHKEVCNLNNKTREKDLNYIVRKTISKRLKQLGMIKYENDVLKFCKKKLEHSDKQLKLKNQKILLEKELKSLYLKKVEETITEEEFKEEYSKYKEKIDNIDNEIEKLKIKNGYGITKEKIEKIIEFFENTKDFDNKILKKLVEKIEIGKENEVYIKLKF